MIDAKINFIAEPALRIQVCTFACAVTRKYVQCKSLSLHILRSGDCVNDDVLEDNRELFCNMQCNG